jgi:hypothetical protein
MVIVIRDDKSDGDNGLNQPYSHHSVDRILEPNLDCAGLSDRAVHLRRDPLLDQIFHQCSRQHEEKSIQGRLHATSEARC